jgi:drug/metabolite transporter, DME family
MIKLIKNYFNINYLNTIGVLSMIIATACWGMTGIFVKFIILDSSMSATALAFWRNFTAFLVMFVYVGIKNKSKLKVKTKNLPWLIGMGASLGIFHIFYNTSVILNGVAVSTVLQAAMPAFVTVFAWYLWKEKITSQKVLAIILTFSGTLLVAGLTISGGSNLNIHGLLVGLCVPVLYASWNLFGKKVRADYDPVVIILYIFGIAALILLPFQPFVDQPTSMSPIVYIAFFGLIIISTITGFLFYAYSLGHLQASVVSILAMTEIAFVSAFSYFLLNEILTLTQQLGTLLVIVGVLLIFLSTSKSTTTS